MSALLAGSLTLAACGTGRDELTMTDVSESTTGPTSVEETGTSDDVTTPPSRTGHTATPAAATPTGSHSADPTAGPTAGPTQKPGAEPADKPTATAGGKPGGTATGKPAKPGTPIVVVPPKKPTTSPPAITVQQAQSGEAAATRGADSVQTSGSVVSGGKTYGISMQAGADASGTLTYGKGSIGIRRVGSRLFLSTDTAFLTGQGHPELVAEYAGEWMEIVPGDPAYAHILPLTEVGHWGALVGNAPASTAKASSGSVILSGGSGGKANTVTLAGTDPMYPVSVTSADHTDRLGFTGWNATDPSVSAPTHLVGEPADDVLDVPTFPEATAVAFSAVWR